jgi:hypothetical protein
MEKAMNYRELLEKLKLPVKVICEQDKDSRGQDILRSLEDELRKCPRNDEGRIDRNASLPNPVISIYNELEVYYNNTFVKKKD